MMSRREIEAAITATVKLMKAEVASGKGEPELRDLTKQAIEAAEKVVGTGGAGAQTRHR